MQEFGSKQFKRFSTLIYNSFGIRVTEVKKEILNTKLKKLMQRYGITSYDEYYKILTGGADDTFMSEFADEITVNKTEFFREKVHFDFISGNMDFWTGSNPRVLQNREIRVWSAACSTGEEPYTIAMVLRECLPEWVNIKILATDINRTVLTAAQQGVYPSSIKNEVAPYYLNKYFNRTEHGYEAAGALKALVSFRLFNLVDSFPFRNSFDMIFCRNVMIYFDSAVRHCLLDKFYNFMAPGGLLFIGHSESITTQVQKFKYVLPTIYLKN